MSNVEFDTDSQSMNYAYRSMSQQSQNKGLTGLIIKMGLAKDENGAKLVMIGILAFNLIVTGFILFKFIL
jgi:hypothetical protein